MASVVIEFTESDPILLGQAAVMFLTFITFLKPVCVFVTLASERCWFVSISQN